MFFYTFMPKLFNMSLTASVAIVFVILLRLLLKKAPKVISYALFTIFSMPQPKSLEQLPASSNMCRATLFTQSIPLLRGLFRASVMRSTRHYRKDGNSWLPTRSKLQCPLLPMFG